MSNTHYPPLHEWRNFFTEFERYSFVYLIQSAVTADINRVEAFFSAFKRNYAPFVKSGGTINVWEVACVSTDEARNCAVLGWLLDCHGSHGQGTSFLRCFLDSVRTVPKNSASCLTLLPQAVDVRPPYHTTLERTYEQGCLENGGQSSRVDIVIENESFLLFIEVKIHAGETGNQLKRYNGILQSRNCGKPCGMIFLTPTGRAAQDESSGDIAYLSWKNLANTLEIFINSQTTSGATILPEQPFWIPLVQQFCHHMRTF